MLTVISHKACLLHNMGLQHPESPARITAITAAITQSKLPCQFIEACQATKEQLMLAHKKPYVQQVYANAPTNQKTYMLDPDTIMVAGTLTAALFAAGSVIQAVDLAMTTENQQIFCNVRPPGHHTETAQAMGFCFFNNLAIGVKHALQQYQLNRIAIVDFDVHHGNGTQAILQDDNKILFCSSYQHPFYPNRGTASTKNSLHIQMAAGTTSKQYRELVKENWLVALNKFQPELLFFSAGFDAHKDDPLANINLLTEDYCWLTKKIMQATCDTTKNRIISVLEGGYNLDILGEATVAHLSAFIA
jgi:acetoin utilization deacetylase AcuC-like enzyme